MRDLVGICHNRPSRGSALSLWRLFPYLWAGICVWVCFKGKSRVSVFVLVLVSVFVIFCNFVVLSFYSLMNYRISAPERLEGAIALPASKSISNRVLLLHALSGGKGSLHHLAKCADTDAVLRALAHDDAQVVDIGAAGTAMRFLTA